MGRLIAGHDWAATPLGPISAWPQSRLTAIAIALASTIPIATIWGPEGILIYNAGYAEFSGDRHPAMLGVPLVGVWPEAAAFNAQVIAEGLAGRTLAYRDQAMLLDEMNSFLDEARAAVPAASGLPDRVTAAEVAMHLQDVVRLGLLHG